MREQIQRFMQDAPIAKTQPFANNPYGVFVRTELPEALYDTGLVDRQKYLITASVGAGNWAMIPWICIFDRSITTSATKGVYIVYLLSKDSKRLYLTFNQGCTEISNSHGKKETKGIEEKLQKVDWNKKDVMIGLLRDQSQFNTCLKHNFYYVPARFVHDGNLPIRYVALCQARYIFGKDAQIAYYGEVKQMQKVKRKEITDIPCRAGTEENDYYRMEIRKWELLPRPIQVKERGVSFITYTNEFLLRHAEIVPELFLKSPEEFRFLTELKRFVNQTSVINDSNEKPVGFAFGDHRVLFQDGKIKLIHNRKIIAQSEIKDFIRRPNAEFRGLMKRITQ